MDTCTPVKLPYFAPAPIAIPTYEEIVTQASLNTIADNPGRVVVKIGKHFIVKYGKDVDFLEGENMLIVQQYTNLPIPKLYAMYQHDPSRDKVLIMEYVAGEVLSTCYDKLDAAHKASVGAQLRSQLRELRKIPSPGVFGALGGRPYLAHPWIFKKSVGPFHSATDFLEAYFNAQFPEARNGSHPGMDELKSQLLELSKNHNAPVFTHADLQGQNIMLRKDGSICIIDWESSSYCPQYFEFFVYRTYEMVSAGISEADNDDFLVYAKMVQLIMKTWDTYIATIT
ncbi:kinase-like domain-containing protein [Xylaria telfairii]|nr:kinase-like domain-containing protein [Xylaria telfairii]